MRLNVVGVGIIRKKKDIQKPEKNSLLPLMAPNAGRDKTVEWQSAFSYLYYVLYLRHSMDRSKNL